MSRIEKSFETKFKADKISYNMGTPILLRSHPGGLNAIESNMKLTMVELSCTRRILKYFKIHPAFGPKTPNTYFLKLLV